MNFLCTLLLMLPPFFQSAREIETIVAHPKTAELLGGGYPIDSIQKIHEGYLVRTLTKELVVYVHYKQTKCPEAGGFCGPSRFELSFAEPTDR